VVFIIVAATVCAIGQPVLVLSKTVTTESGACPGGATLTIKEGESVKYCYVVENTGDAAALDVTVKDNKGDITWTTPYSVPLVGLTDEDGDNVDDDLAAGATATGVYVQALTWPGTVTNEAEAEGEDETNPGAKVKSSPPYAEATVTVEDRFPVLTLAKTVTTETGDCATAGATLTICPNETVKYCYVVENTGDAAALDVTVKDNRGDITWTTPSSIPLVGLTDEDGDNVDDDLAAGATAAGEMLRGFGGSGAVTNEAEAEGEDETNPGAKVKSSPPYAEATVTVDATPPAVPSNPNLVDGSDSGSSNTDNETNDYTPTFSGTAEAGVLVKLYAGVAQIGFATASGGGTWEITSSVLLDGTYAMTATASDDCGNESAASSSLSVTIDTTDPVISNVSVTNSTIATNDYIKDGDSATVTASVIDTNLSDGDTGYIEADLSGLGGGPSVSPTSFIGGTATWNLPSVNCTPVDGTVTVRVDAEDPSGNQATQGNDTIIADNTDPVADLVVITNTTVSTQDCVKNGQNVTVTARVTDDNLQPDIGAGGDEAYIFADLTGFGGGAAVNPDSYVITGQGPTATWTLTGVTCTPADGTVTVTIDAYDRAYNAAAQDSDTITADNTAPTIDSITSSTADGCYNVGDTINVTVIFSENVTLAGGNLTVNLDSGGSVTIAPFSWNDTASGTYTVLTGHNSCDLDVSSLVLDGGATLCDCPWNTAILTPPAGDNLADNESLIVDTMIPVIIGVDVQGPGIWLSNEAVDSDCCFVALDFEAQITDNCSISFDDIDVAWDYGTGSPTATVENLTWWRKPGQTDVDVVDIIGMIDVRCLSGCPTVIVLTVTATDCSGNVATPLVSDDSTMGQVVDTDAPEPRDDPRQDMYEASRPDLDVRLDRYNVFRLMIREDTPDRIDVLWNDDDNCTGKAAIGDCRCCGTIEIESITVPPAYGTAAIEISDGDCATTPQIRYAPDSGFVGPDQFKYRVVDRCGNVSREVTVYVQVIEEVRMEDVPVLACANGPTAFTVSATDLWVDIDDPTIVPFTFAVLGGPEHGVLTGDLLDIFYTPPSMVPDPTNPAGSVPSLDFMEGARIAVVYIPSAGFVGRDLVRIEFTDPFGGRATSLVDVVVDDCAGSGIALEIVQGETLRLLMPTTFETILDSAWASVTLRFLADGTTYPEALSAVWDEELGRYILILDAEPLPVGTYELIVPLGNGESVVLTLEVGVGV